MKTRNLLLTLLLLSVTFLPATAQDAFNWPYKIDNGVIKTEVPARPAGQQDAINLCTPKLSVVRVGFVGLGMRGYEAVRRWIYQEGVQIVGLCDHEADRVKSSNDQLRKAGLPPAAEYSGEDGYKALCERQDIDLVYIATDWLHHVPVAKYAMERGKHVAIEVPSAMTMRDCWELIDLSEKTRLHCFMLENCCYDFFELNTLHMAQQGLFGEVMYGAGAYRHCLDPYWNEYWKNGPDDKLGWRLDYNMRYRGDVYATHGLGPVAQLMNIHRGDRFLTLSAMDTKSVRGKETAEKRLGHAIDSFRQGDITNTMIRTANGKMIQIMHSTTIPQPYNRMFQIVGTEGMANKYPVEGYSLTHSSMVKGGIQKHGKYWEGEEYLPKEDFDQLVGKYTSPMVTKYEKKAKEVGGHGGMDFIEDSRLVYCLQHGLPMDIDVYDLAEWCSLAELGSLSMDNGCMPVEVPDFTRGHWEDQKGYRHYYATEAEEQAQDKANHEFTLKLKASSEKLWKKYDKKNKK